MRKAIRDVLFTRQSIYVASLLQDAPGIEGGRDLWSYNGLSFPERSSTDTAKGGHWNLATTLKG
jgi:hypothetical protein